MNKHNEKITADNAKQGAEVQPSDFTPTQKLPEIILHENANPSANIHPIKYVPSNSQTIRIELDEALLEQADIRTRRVREYGSDSLTTKIEIKELFSPKEKTAAPDLVPPVEGLDRLTESNLSAITPTIPLEALPKSETEQNDRNKSSANIPPLRMSRTNTIKITRPETIKISKDRHPTLHIKKSAAPVLAEKVPSTAERMVSQNKDMRESVDSLLSQEYAAHRWDVFFNGLCLSGIFCSLCTIYVLLAILIPDLPMIGRL